MKDEWSYLLFDTLINKILNGKQSVQEPIRIYNLSQTKTNNISFLNHLLMYESVNKGNLLECLFKIYDKFIEKIEELKQNKNILNMVDMVGDEWYGPKNCGCNYGMGDNFFDDYYNGVMGKRNLKIVCKKCIDDSHKNDKIPFESFLRRESPNDRLLKSGIIMSKEVLELLERNLSETEKLLEFFKNFNTSFYIDLAIKHKPLYFQLNGIRDESIPDNIHLIFSNFLNIHNLLYKQLVQHRNHLKGEITGVKTSSESVNDRKKQIDLANSILEQKRVIKELPFNVGDEVIYKGRERVNVFDIDRNVPKDEPPIIYVEFRDGQKRDTPHINLSVIPPEDPEEDDDTYHTAENDEMESLLYGGGDNDVKGAEKISKKIINFF
jgi:hypothetical protein